MDMVYPKYQKYIRTKETNNRVPENWEEFVQLCTIRSGGNMVQFNPYEYQKILSRLMDKHNIILITKSRQIGTTQCVASKFLHRACLNPAYSSMAFMRNQEDTAALSRRVRQMVSGIEKYVTPDNDNVNYLKLKNLGEIYFRNSSAEGSRSYDSVLDFLFDESAYQHNIESIYSSSSPSSALGGNNITKVIVSTPSAKSGWYWNRLTENNWDWDVEHICSLVARGELFSEELPGLFYWVDAVGACKLILHFRCHPVYVEMNRCEPGGYLAYRQRQDGTDEETIAREYDLRFVDNAVSVFDAELVRSCATGKLEEKRESGARYYAGLDTSTSGKDYLSFVILKELNKKYSLVAFYRKRRETSAVHLYHLGEMIEFWKPENMGIEVTGGVGYLYLEQLQRRFFSKKFEAIHTTGDSKPIFISTLKLALETQILQYPAHQIILDELLSFQKIGEKLSAPSGKHDDVLMALCFTLMVSPFGAHERQEIVFSDDVVEKLKKLQSR